MFVGDEDEEAGSVILDDYLGFASSNSLCGIDLTIDVNFASDIVVCDIEANVLNCTLLFLTADEILTRKPDGTYSTKQIEMKVTATMEPSDESENTSLQALVVERTIIINIFYCKQSCLYCDENKIATKFVPESPPELLGNFHYSYSEQVLGLLLERTEGCTAC